MKFDITGYKNVKLVLPLMVGISRCNDSTIKSLDLPLDQLDINQNEEQSTTDDSPSPCPKDDEDWISTEVDSARSRFVAKRSETFVVDSSPARRVRFDLRKSRSCNLGFLDQYKDVSYGNTTNKIPSYKGSLMGLLYSW